MKLRSGFVSNSSSSSFIVISPLSGPIKVDRWMVNDDILVVDRNSGEGEFGWQYETYYDLGSKLIFAFCQADYILNNPYHDNEDSKKQGRQWMDMLEKVLKDTLNVKEVVWNITTKYGEESEGRDHVYIDHQSASYEGQNIDMFASEQALKSFLFNHQSYIQTDNDNH